MKWIRRYIDRTIKEQTQRTVHDIKSGIESEIRTQLHKLVGDIYNSDKSSYEEHKIYQFRRTLDKIIREELRSALKAYSGRMSDAQSVKKSALDIVERQTKKEINSEEFIDEIVERIKRKQLYK